MKKKTVRKKPEPIIKYLPATEQQVLIAVLEGAGYYATMHNMVFSRADSDEHLTFTSERLDNKSVIDLIKAAAYSNGYQNGIAESERVVEHLKVMNNNALNALTEIRKLLTSKYVKK